MNRPWDGRVREVVGVRWVVIGRSRERVRIERLECGHEKAFEGALSGFAAHGSRVCGECNGGKS